MFGYTTEEMAELGVMDIHPAADVQSVIADFQAQAAGKKKLADNTPCLRKDRTIFYADISSSRVELSGKLCVVGFFTDITQRRKAEEKLLEQDRQLEETSTLLETVLNTIPDIIGIQNTDHNASTPCLPTNWSSRG